MKTKIVIVLASVTMLVACSRSKLYDEKEMSADTVGVPVADQNSPEETKSANQVKLVKTADMKFKVKDVRQTGDSIATLTARYGGLVMNHQMGSVVEAKEVIHLSNDSLRKISVLSTTADMTVSIPSQHLEAFMNRVGRMTVQIDSSKMLVEDKTLDYLSADLKTKNRKDWVAQKKTGDGARDNADAVLATKDNMVDSRINNQRTNAAAKYSVLALSFYQSKLITKETVANDDPSAYHPSFFSQLSLSLQNGWYVFSNIVFAVANLWAFLLVAVALWVGYRVYRKKFATIKA